MQHVSTRPRMLSLYRRVRKLCTFHRVYVHPLVTSRVVANPVMPPAESMHNYCSTVSIGRKRIEQALCIPTYFRVLLCVSQICFQEPPPVSTITIKVDELLYMRTNVGNCAGPDATVTLHTENVVDPLLQAEMYLEAGGKIRWSEGCCFSVS